MPDAYFFIILLCWYLVEFDSVQTNIIGFRTLKDSEIIESDNGNFEIGFFSPGNSTNRYVAIWYTNNDSNGLEVVWVANRDNPVQDSTGVLNISEDGNLQVLDELNKIFWSSNLAAYKANGLVLQLKDNGNLILNATGKIMWQSFDHPTDTILPGMVFSMNKSVTEKQKLLRSWTSPSDPYTGNFTFGLTTRNPPELFIWHNDRPIWRNAPWNGNISFGSESVVSIVNNDDGLSSLGFSVGMIHPNNLLHYVMNCHGDLVGRTWENVRMQWQTIWNPVQSDCDVYGKCGPFGICGIQNSVMCNCLTGFIPKNDIVWSQGNWSEGCVRRIPLQCGVTGNKSDRFWTVGHVKVPDNAMWSPANNEGECSDRCKGACSCLAYSYYYNLGCMIWNDTLTDTEALYAVTGIDLHIRLPSSDLDVSNQEQIHRDSIKRKLRKWSIIAAVLVTTGILLLGVFVYHLRTKWRLSRTNTGTTTTSTEARQQWKKRLRRYINLKHARDHHVEFGDVPTFELEKLLNATNSFHESNKLGRGGFGTVYKGILENGEEIAIKRLSNLSGQGFKEFKTEVELIGKLQHRNLVRLLGCCAEGEEKMLVYEYMPNKSLDVSLFDRPNGEHLDWKTRFTIIQGICRGLLYLHRDSRLRIIHRDLKASNILLDANLAPKISDFGMARIFGGNDDRADTNRIVGTYGYMSPEYAMEGRFSEKSDVFSFGVLLLEITSGRRNNSFNEEVSFSLLRHAWNLWNEDEVVSLIDPTISGSSSQMKILRCIQVALLCVQQLAEERPNISEIISMIDSEVSNLPIPKQPGFTQRRDKSAIQAADGNEYQSVNLVSLSLVDAR